MDFDITWLLLGLPIAFAGGWLASRLDIRQLRVDNRRSPKAYFKGLNHLLNEQQDEAIDAFIEAVQKDPDTSELHFALGNLFRRRGEYDRAVRVHEHLLARGDLSKLDRQRAQQAIALDYLQAGLLDRAEDALGQLEGSPFESQARLARLAILERTRDWTQAAAVAEQLQASGQADFTHRMAHYLCEQAIDAQGSEQTRLLQQAMLVAPQAPRARIALARLLQEQGQSGAALDMLIDLIKLMPSAAPLIAHQMAALATACLREQEVRALLEGVYQQTLSVDLLQAIIGLLPANAVDSRAGRDFLLAHLRQEPSLSIVAQFMQDQDTPAEIQRALNKAAEPLRRYRCASCGFEARQHYWQCPGCQSWDSYSPRRVEEL